MSIGVLLHSGFISSLPASKKGNPSFDPWYVLKQKDEVINFIDENGQKRSLNSLLIEAETTDLYININGYILYVPAGQSRNYDYERIDSIQVLNEQGTKLRWSGLFY